MENKNRFKYLRWTRLKTKCAKSSKYKILDFQTNYVQG